MRISDWSSDVCSSDLTIGLGIAMFCNQFADVDEIGRAARHAEFLAFAVHRRGLFGRWFAAGHGFEQDDVEVGAVFVAEELDRRGTARRRDLGGLGAATDEVLLLARRALDDLEQGLRRW